MTAGRAEAGSAVRGRLEAVARRQAPEAGTVPQRGGVLRDGGRHNSPSPPEVPAALTAIGRGRSVCLWGCPAGVGGG